MSNNQNISKDNVPPQNIDAEQSLLGCLMVDKDAITKVADMIEPRDFYKEKHKQNLQSNDSPF